MTSDPQPGAMRRLWRAAALAAAVMLSSAPAEAVHAIVALVDDDIISVRDLEQRTRLALLSSGIPDTERNRQRMSGQVLRSLIDERLQSLEARRHDVSVGEEAVAAAVAEIERRNRMAAGRLRRMLEGAGIAFRVMEERIRATLGWQNLVLRRLSSRVSVGDDEVAEALERLRKNQGREEYRLAEILLAVDSPKDEAGVRESARRIAEQIRGGAAFGALARQFSRSATAAVGGDLGWTLRSEIDPDIVEAVVDMAKGAVLDPVRTPAGYRILSLIDRRRVGVADGRDSTIRLLQMFQPAGGADAADAIAARLRTVGTRPAAPARCAEAAVFARSIGLPPPLDLGSIAIGDLAPRVRDAVADIPTGGVSAPIRASDGVILLLVCDRRDPEIVLPDPAQIRERIRAQRLDLLAQRYMRDLRRAAIVEIRAAGAAR